MSSIVFQDDGSDKIFKGLKSEKKRFLLADEVGLGKTVTAANVIRKYAQWKIEEKKKNNNNDQNDGITIHVGYLCGNEALAKENIRKLKDKIEGIGVDSKRPERMSLAFKRVYSENNKIGGDRVEIYPLTPSTTIKVTSDGTLEERAFAYYLLTYQKSNDELLEKCVRPKKETDTTDGSVKDKMGYAKTFMEENKSNPDFNAFLKSLRKLFEKTWENSNQKFYENCIEKLTDSFHYDHYIYEADYICYVLLEKGIIVGKRKKVSGSDKEIKMLMENHKDIYDEFKKMDKNKIKEEFAPLVKPYEGQKTETVKKHIETYLKNNDMFNYLIFILDNIKTNKDTYSHKALSDIIDLLKKKTKNYNANNSSKYVIDKKSIQNRSAAKEIFVEKCCREMIRTARKCMAVQSIKELGMDLFLADEVQNYSEIFRSRKSSAGSEMDLVVDELIMSDKYNVVLMSATPFRFHTKISERENTDRDPDADSRVNDEQNGNIDKAKQYIEHESDIYNEFEMIIKYLLGNIPDEKKEKWLRIWKRINNLKFSIVSGEQQIDDNTRRYKKYVGKQSRMLEEAGISRVERYMSGIPIEISGKDERLKLKWNNILRKELRRMPSGNMAEISSDELADGDIIIFYDEWYLYRKSEKKLWRANDILGKFELFSPLYEYSEDHDDHEEAIYKICKKEDDDDIYDYEYGEYYLSETYAGDNEEKESIKKIKALIENNRDNISLRRDFIKSTPAFFSFKQGYIRLINMSDKNYTHTLSGKRIRDLKKLFADGKNDEADKELLYNARIAELFRVLFDEEKLHKLLFIPPSRGDVKLKGVFAEKRGISKRLFFSDYNMTPRSLSALLSYEAARRTVEDIKNIYLIHYDKSQRLVRITPEKDAKTFDAVDLTKFSEFPMFGISVDDLFSYDKAQYDNKKLIDGSPYRYVRERKELFGSCSDTDIENFCKAYFYYMTKRDSLRVIAAYSTGSSLYDMIVNYGADGCIYDVLDEYFDYIIVGDKETKAAAFSRILGYAPCKEGGSKDRSTHYKVSVYVKDDVHTVEMPVSFAVGHFAGDTVRGSEANTLNMKIRQFNSPFRPMQFITTSIGQEGFDFHMYCRKVVHWSLEFNPVKFEQREGRINRYQGYAQRLNLYDGYFSGKNAAVKNFKNWTTAFKEVTNKKAADSKGLFPDFVVPMSEDMGLTRECYYYPDSIEDHELGNVLRAVGYYRALLGQESRESFEDDFIKFAAGADGQEKNIREFFVDLYPRIT